MYRSVSNVQKPGQPNRYPAGSEHEIRTILHQQFVIASERAREAAEFFDATVSEIPSFTVPRIKCRLLASK